MTITQPTHSLIIDSQFRDLLSPLSNAAYTALEADIVENGCRDPIVVWEEESILLDGHNRHSICCKHEIHFDVEYVRLATREQAKRWIIKHQVSRRNISSKENSYLRGEYYESVKGEWGATKGNKNASKRSGKNFHSENQENVRDQVAKEFGCTDRTISNDYHFYKAINTIQHHLGDRARFTLVSSECKLNREEIRSLGKIFEDDVSEAIECYEALVGENADTKRKPSQILKQYRENAERAKSLVEDELSVEKEASAQKQHQEPVAEQNGHQKDGQPVPKPKAENDNATGQEKAEYDDSKETTQESSSMANENNKETNRPELSLSSPTSEDKPQKKEPHTEMIEDEKGRKIYVKHTPNVKPTFNSANEEIDWAFWTWNPVTGCWHGCDYCYARDIAIKFNFETGFEPTFYPDRLQAPYRMKPMPEHQIEKKADDRGVDLQFARIQAKNVFTGSMSDIFGKWVPQDWIQRIFDTVKENPQWNFLFLTKFPQRLQEVNDILGGFPDNVWVGTSVDTQVRVKVAEKAFKGISARLKWLSCEPMLEELTFNDLSGFDLVVIGGASPSKETNGTPATPEFQPKWEWVYSLTKQAYDAGCSVYWKENLKTRPKEFPLDQIQ